MTSLGEGDGSGLILIRPFTTARECMEVGGPGYFGTEFGGCSEAVLSCAQGHDGSRGPAGGGCSEEGPAENWQPIRIPTSSEFGHRDSYGSAIAIWIGRSGKVPWIVLLWDLIA